MLDEKRNYLRREAKLNFTYKVKGSDTKEEKSITKNIDSGGICGLVDEKIKKGVWLELNIYLPTKEEPISVIAKVVWTADKKDDKIDVGIKFEEIDLRMKTKLLKYLSGSNPSQLRGEI